MYEQEERACHITFSTPMSYLLEMNFLTKVMSSALCRKGPLSFAGGDFLGHPMVIGGPGTGGVSPCGK